MMNNSGSDNSSPILHRSAFLRSWLPAFVWMAAIFLFSTDHFSSHNTGSILFTIFHALLPSLTEAQFHPYHILIRKAAHFTEYAILALLLFRGFRGGAPEKWRASWAWSVVGCVVVYALLDEYHQSFTATRGASIYDSMIDSAGGSTAMLLLWFWRRGKRGAAAR